jgi:hypothetical protein
VKVDSSSQAFITCEGSAVPGIVDGIDSSQIWAAVERIQQSRAMSDCPRLMQFFRFVVASTLKGEAMHLKETTIGVAVFGRSPDYDPKADTIVRSQAWRLRSKLRKYYASEGAQESIVIDLPIGHYVPTFRLRDQGGDMPSSEEGSETFDPHSGPRQ